jgi:hypothetical protein
VSDLSLSVQSIASNLMVNDDVDFSLAFREDNTIVDSAEFLELLDIRLTINTLDVAAGTTETWSKHLSEGLIPGNGIYKTLIKRFNKIGEYEVIVDVDGKTFQRRSVQRINVRTAFKIVTQTVIKGNKTQFNIEIIPQRQNVDFTNIEVVAKIKPPTGSSLIKPFELINDQAWTLSIKPEAEGIYYVTMRITTKNSDGVSNDIVPEALSFTLPVADSSFVDHAEVVEDIVLEAEPLEPAVIEEEPPIETSVDAVEPVVEKKKAESNMMQWILYGSIGLVNLIIIGGIFILYCKFVKPKEEPVDIDENNAENEPQTASAIDELPMDEMMINELNELDELDELDELGEFDNTMDQAGDDSVDKAVSASDGQAELPSAALDKRLADDEDLFADTESELDNQDVGATASAEPELTKDLTKDDASGEFKAELIDEDPEFNLDEFAPDQLDNDESETKK